MSRRSRRAAAALTRPVAAPSHAPHLMAPPSPDMIARSLVRHAAGAPFNDRFQISWGSNLTPQGVTGVLQNADSGMLYMLADMLDEARERDGHLHAELQKRELRVAGADWEMMPPEGSGARGETIAKWCAARLKEIESREDLARSFGEAVADLQGAVYQGRVGLEVVWDADPFGWTIPRTLYFIHPRRFAYATDWRLHLWDASGTAPGAWQPNDTCDAFGIYPGLPLDVFPPGKFVVHRPRVRGVYPTREGLGRLLIWWSTFKRFGVRDFLAFAEWAGRGLRLGTFATGRGPMGTFTASPEDQAILEQVLNQMSSSSPAVFADTTKPEIKDAPHNNDVHDRLISLCNNEISKATVGGTLGSDSGSRGARSLGEVHERNELMIAKADAASINATLVRDLIRPMVEMNFGPGAPVPWIRFVVEPSEDTNALADRLEKAVRVGVKVGQRDARNMLGFPDPAADDPPVVPIAGPGGGALKSVAE